MSEKDYLQPDFYHFNQDSLDLVSFIKSKLDSVNSILDLGAGCGVIGLELGRHYLPKFLSFVELQEDFRESLESNIVDFLPPKMTMTLDFKSFAQWAPHRKFDLVVCNPPYYQPNRGQKASDPRRNLARSFVTDDWPTLVNAIRKSLSSDGVAYIVLKNENEITQEALKSCQAVFFSCQQHIYRDLLIIELS